MADEDVQDQELADSEPHNHDDAAEGGDEVVKASLTERLKESVEVQMEDVGTLRKKLMVSVPQNLVAEQKDEQYGELRRDAVVPGFRRGRAPRRLLEKRFGSDVADTLVQQLVSNGYMAAVDKLGLKPIGDPMVWVREKDAETDTLVDVQKAIELLELPEEGPLSFVCEVEVRPEFELPELDGIPVTKPVLAITDQDVTEHLERFRRNLGHYEAVPEEAVQADDVVYVDLKLSAEGNVLHEHAGMRVAARGQVVEGVQLPTLGETLAGARIGDMRTTTGVLPESYEKAELRGKEASIEFKINEIHRLKLPDVNEEYFKHLGFENEQDARTFVRAQLESRLGQEIRRGMRGQVQKHLLEHAPFELPPQLSDRQVDSVVVRRMLELYNQGFPPAEVEKHMDELKTSARESVVRDLKLAFIMEKLAEKIEVEVTESEMNGMIAEIAQRQRRRFDRVRDELIKQGNATSLYISLRDEKILNQLVDKANVTEKAPEAGEKPSAENSGG